MFCTKCGNQYVGTPTFCSRCGDRLSEARAPSSWFSTNPNWTLVIALGAAWLSYFVSALVAYAIMGKDHYQAALLVIIPVCSIAPAIVGGWVLKQKGRSLWWLPLVLVPYWIGTAVWLALDNKRQSIASQTVSETHALGPTDAAFGGAAVEPDRDGAQEEQTCCPSCGTEVPEYSKFCLECGTGLGQGAPPGVSEGTEATPSPLEESVNTGAKIFKAIVALLMILLLLFVIVAVAINRLS